MIVVSTGCPAGIGPEVSVAAVARLRGVPRVLVGDERTLMAAAELVGVSRSRFARYDAARRPTSKILLLSAGPTLRARDRRPGSPTERSGEAQLAYVDAAYALARSGAGRALVTGPVSKAAIARSSAAASDFVGHTEWLAARDGAPDAVMCFWSEKLVTSLATTHLPLARVSGSLSPSVVERAILAAVELPRTLGVRRPRVAVASLNPHAGESELLGEEESRAISPGIRRARKKLGRRAAIDGPVGAETAYRRALGGHYDAVVAMYHDQATIPLKLVAFGDAVNVTMGLSVVRTSVDHGTGYDIAWKGKADPRGMLSAMKLAVRMLRRK